MIVLVALLVWIFSSSLSHASLTDTYLSLSGAGANDGTNCANARAGSFFNSSSNWGAGSSQIGSDTTVHLCGLWTGGNATTFLQFQGSGTAGHVVTVKFETGAEMRPNYCGQYGCIDLNGKSYITITGTTVCGNTGAAGGWTTIPCTERIQNFAIGSITKTCPNGLACVAFSGNSKAIGSFDGAGDVHDIIIQNLEMGPMYTRDTADASSDALDKVSGFAVAGAALHHHITLHHAILHGVHKAFVVSDGGLVADLCCFDVHNVTFYDQCWAMGVAGDGGNSWNMTTLTFHDNEVTDWANWTITNGCHGNGTMWFNGNETATHSPRGFIGTSDSSQYNNYVHGDLTGGYGTSSPSGYLSCQDNCTDVLFFNNVIVSTCVTSTCGGMVYFNGPGGGGQKVYNNTFVGTTQHIQAIKAQAITNPLTWKNNIVKGAVRLGTVDQATLTGHLTSDYNLYYQFSDLLAWNGGNSYGTLAAARAAGFETNGIAGSDPLLTAAYKLQAGSPAIGTGTNLTSLGITALNTDAAGVARPASAAWDIGAFQMTSSDTTPPSAPSNLRIVSFTFNQINLAWDSSTDNTAVTGYLMERVSGGVCAGFSQIGTTTNLSYSDIGILTNTAYCFRVRATDAANNLSGYSSNISQTTDTAKFHPTLNLRRINYGYLNQEGSYEDPATRRFLSRMF